uniref:CD74 molecule, major histocompatibility complex, class II invariant chain a n=1 Tax=Neogobius melanostomus TaxID=47308 RepID=A0A8C6UEQ4_9GOBI
MEHVSEDAPLARDSRTGSEQVLVEPAGPTGSSNRQALKIAGITTLVCLLLSAQAFTAYMVFNQRQQIQGLEGTNKELQKQMVQRPSVNPQRMVMPEGSLPLLDFSDDEKSPNPTTTKPAPKVQLNKARPSVEEQLQEFMKDFELPHFNQSFLANLETLQQQLNETSWTSFESWLRYWLLFQMAQKTPTSHTASLTWKKCLREASSGPRRGMLGSYRPQCDEQGNYRPMQCWHSTRQCWCVDENGTPIEGSKTQGHLDCDKVLRSSRTSAHVMRPGLFEKGSEEE